MTSDRENTGGPGGQETLHRRLLVPTASDTSGAFGGDHPKPPGRFRFDHLVDDDSLLVRTAEGTKLGGAVGRLVAFDIDRYNLTAGTA